MFVRDNLQKLKVGSDASFPNPLFLLMSIGAVIAPIFFFAMTPNTLWQSGLFRTLLPIGLLILVSAGGSLMMVRSNSYAGTPSFIRPKSKA